MLQPLRLVRHVKGVLWSWLSRGLRSMLATAALAHGTAVPADTVWSSGTASVLRGQQLLQPVRLVRHHGAIL